MKQEWIDRIGVVVMAVLCIGGTLLFVTQVAAQERPAFAHDARLVSDWLDGHSAQAVPLLEAICTQAQLDALEAAMFPAPTDAEKLAALESAKRELQRAGLTDAAPAIVEVEKAIDAVPVAAETAKR